MIDKALFIQTVQYDSPDSGSHYQMPSSQLEETQRKNKTSKDWLL